ncbi:helix-turn-helix domain-containing protein [Actinoplanes subtropicus]|uniref:helix-turn-helix domain-containing protein n=1 Tax=Actinoplanes subtropicus TaxID=543632 RepID=UPI001B80E490
MPPDFGSVLRGLMENRNLSPSSLSRASARAESTIRRLLAGDLEPRADLIQDIAPVLQISLADLLVIAGLPSREPLAPRLRQDVQAEIGRLVALASPLPSEQIQQLINIADELNGRLE